jgi:hypothetical protein
MALKGIVLRCDEVWTVILAFPSLLFHRYGYGYGSCSRSSVYYICSQLPGRLP